MGHQAKTKIPVACGLSRNALLSCNSIGPSIAIHMQILLCRKNYKPGDNSMIFSSSEPWVSQIQNNQLQEGCAYGSHIR